jgi:RNA polymerase sigma-70 factor (ECF subfamily)
MAVARDLWERINNRCPLEHRSILGLRRHGYTLTDIADRTGLHPDSVRRVLRTLARDLASTKNVE